ncbi:prepilin-type N-terminal cleavage/methylation domain-containing protein, partial [Candidatus Saccharibacteria bacterium]|nr:prepilin-type N-terminal cleavage/methylation domain-containing protein [Candidatus Saccharibacteria bacterium]
MTFISLDTNLGGGTIKGMKNTYANKPNTLQGFTIVELLIVIVVIAILAVISVAAYSNIQMKARNSV